jgi:protein-S-isoprenylcysteine O-methyltransferase Ste14
MEIDLTILKRFEISKITSLLLLLQNWIAGWGFLVTLLPLYLARVKEEEQMMLDEFGDQYRSYMRKTGRLLPKCKIQP